MARRGRFIVLEGIDGAGTSTQARRLVAWLQARGRKAWLTCEPSAGPVGRQLRRILSGRLQSRSGRALDAKAVALLFAADRIDHLRDEIRPRLAEGVHVVSDRYLASSLAYQSLDAPLDWVRTINAYAPPPDLTLFLDVPPAVALARRAERGREERFDALPLQRRIARRYREVLRSERGLGQVVVIDGGRPVREVEADVKEAVRSLPGLRRL